MLKNFESDSLSLFDANPEPAKLDRVGQIAIVKELAIRLGLSSENTDTVLELLARSPARPVGKSALTNVTVRFSSPKCTATVSLESHSCELVHAYELDWDDNVLTFATQVPCEGIVRYGENGRKNVSSLVADALVVRSTGIEVVEAKHLDELQKLRSGKPLEWDCTDGVWCRPPFDSWARHRGIRYTIWSPPRPFGLYLQNLELIVALRTTKLLPRDLWLAKRAVRALAKGPRSLSELISEIPTFTAGIAALLLAKRIIFGTIKSASLGEPDSFLLFLHEEQAQLVDDRRHASLATSLGALTDGDDHLVGLSPKAFSRATSNRDKVLSHIEKGTKISRRLKALVPSAKAALDSGEDLLPLFVPDFSSCGNRHRRLVPMQVEILDRHAHLEWEGGRSCDFSQLRDRIGKACEAAGVDKIGDTTIRRAMKAKSCVKRAILTGGKRSFHKVRPCSDPRDRTLPPLAPGFRLHIDSSKFDARLAPALLPQLRFDAPTVYVAVDACFRGPAAHALIFGAARTDGLAILIRDYVRRHGRLPRQIFVDRGSENRSHWLRDFCEQNSIALFVSPSGGSRWNSSAENLIGRLNSQLSHRLPGSTLPDQRGRSVDGAFKSRKTAFLQFDVIAKECDRTLYDHFLNYPFPDGGTPNEIKDQAIEAFGVQGTPCSFDDLFLIQTSVSIPLAKVDRVKGVRLVEGRFSSDALFRAAARGKPTDMRLDCVNPTRLYVRFSDGWVVARSTQAQVMSSLIDRDQQFRLMYAPLLRSEADVASRAARQEHFSRLEAAAAQSPATAHLSEADEDVVTEARHRKRNVNWDELPDLQQCVD